MRFVDDHSPDSPSQRAAVEGVRRGHGHVGDVAGLDGLDLRVEAGSVFGLLGPNGAGKTTLVRVLATLLRPTSGRARVLGHDVVAESLAVRRRIGLAGQFAAVDGELTGRENVEMVGRLYRLSAAELLDRFGPSPQSPMTPKLPAASRSYRDSRPQAALHQRPSGRSRSPRIDRSPSRRRPQGRAPR